MKPSEMTITLPLRDLSDIMKYAVAHERLLVEHQEKLLELSHVRADLGLVVQERDRLNTESMEFLRNWRDCREILKQIQDALFILAKPGKNTTKKELVAYAQRRLDEIRELCCKTEATHESDRVRELFSRIDKGK